MEKYEKLKPGKIISRSKSLIKQRSAYFFMKKDSCSYQPKRLKSHKKTKNHHNIHAVISCIVRSN